jgi:Ca2+-binding EF-hand superfamily protein
VKEEIKIEEQVTVTHHDDVEIGLHNHGGGRSSSSSSSNSSLSKESSPSKEEQERRWRALFDRIDRNSDGHLTRVELLAALRRASPEVTRELHELLGIPERVRQEDGTRDDFVRVFEAIDRDESDSIELDEFVAYLQKANERWVGSGPPNSGEGSGDGDGDGRDGASRERLGEDWRQTHPRPLSVSASAAVAVNRRSSTPQRSGPSDGAEETSPDEAPDDAIPQDQIIIPQEGEVITPPEAEESLPREEVSTSQEEWSPPQDQIITPQEGEVITPPEAEEEALPQDEIASTPPKEVTPSPDNAAASPADDVPPDDDAAAPPEESSSPTTASITQGEDGAPDEGDPPLEDAESKDVAPFDEETLPLEDGAVPLLENVPSRSEQKGKFEEDSDTEEDTDVESDAEENEQILRERKPNP